MVSGRPQCQIKWHEITFTGSNHNRFFSLNYNNFNIISATRVSYTKQNKLHQSWTSINIKIYSSNSLRESKTAIKCSSKCLIHITKNGNEKYSNLFFKRVWVFVLQCAYVLHFSHAQIYSAKVQGKASQPV